MKEDLINDIQRLCNVGYRDMYYLVVMIEDRALHSCLSFNDIARRVRDRLRQGVPFHEVLNE